MTQNNNTEARTWAMLAHLSSLVWLPLTFVGLAFPILNIVGPLVVWLTKKNEHQFVDDQGKESLNFQISFTLYSLILVIVLVILGIILAVALGITANSSSANSGGLALILGFGFIGLFILSMFLGVIQLILVIIATVTANNGQFYRYPFTIRFLR